MSCEIAADDLSPEEVYGDGERADRFTFCIDHNVLYRGAEQHSLFSARREVSDSAFGHQSWAEYLAAAYLSERVQDAERLLSLLRWAEDRPHSAKTVGTGGLVGELVVARF
jgi:hypothetical protein